MSHALTKDRRFVLSPWRLAAPAMEASPITHPYPWVDELLSAGPRSNSLAAMSVKTTGYRNARLQTDLVVAKR